MICGAVLFLDNNNSSELGVETQEKKGLECATVDKDKKVFALYLCRPL